MASVPLTTVRATFALIRSVWSFSRGRTLLLGTWVLWEALRPFLQALAVARLVDALTNFVTAGPGGTAPGTVGFWVAVASLVLLAGYLLNRLIDPFLTGLVMDLDRHMGVRLLQAVAHPAGIAHLEDPESADQIALARGSILGKSAGQALRILGRYAGTRLSALATGLALFQFRWWAPLVILAGLLITRLWAQRDMQAFMNGFQLATPVLRRAAYYRDLLLSADAAKEVRLFGLTDLALERFRSGWQKGIVQVFDLAARNRWVLMAAVTTQGIAFGAVAVSVALAGARGEITPGQVTFYLQVAFAMLGIIANVDADYQLARAAASFEQVAKLHRRLVAEETPRLRDSAGLPQREIRFERVRFRYPNQERSVFDDLDLVIPVGRSLAIVGPNGAGKTTLVKLLAKLYEPDGGRILVDGVDLRELDPASWRTGMAVLFQDFCRWALPVRDNVALSGPAPLGDEVLLKALERAGAQEIVSSLPQGLDTPLSRRFRGGVDLSGGQWQRIALARALAAVERGARILILDEPTASLDVRAEAAFYERFLELTKGLTTILISHRFSTVRLADQIVVVDGGRIIEQGTHEELMRLDGAYARMFRLQAERFQDPAPEEASDAELPEREAMRGA